LTSGPSEPLDFVTYAEFGEQFFRHAVSEKRLLQAVELLAGQPIDLKPTAIGPGRLVKLSAHGGIGAATAEPISGAEVGHVVRLPVELGLAVDFGLEVHRFDALLDVPLVVTVRAMRCLRVYLDVTPPTAEEIRIDLQAQGLRASVVQRVAGFEGEVRRFVASFIARELEKPHVRAARLFDVAEAIDAAWDRVVDTGSGSHPDPPDL
jgi:hypothetical protein